jgi:hypothetical protein
MRATVAILTGISVLFVGVIAMNDAAESAYEPAVINGTNESAAAYNVSQQTFNQLGVAGGDGIVWMGIAAIILLALGLLVVASNRGGR